MIEKSEEKIMKNWKNKNIPLVSICCITYNHEEYIKQALDSFLMQETDFPFEIIVRDDCSPDNTAVIIKKYVKNYPNIIKPIFEKENQHSQGISSGPVVYGKARGKYIALCEGDDYWISSLKLQKQVNLLKSNSSLKGVHTKVLYIDKDNKEIGKSNRVEKGFEIIDYRYLAQRNTIHTCSFMLESSIINKEYHEMRAKAPVGDLVIFLKTSLEGNIGYIDELMSTYRRGVGVSKDWTSEKSHQNILSVYKIFNDKYKIIRPFINISKRYYHYKLSIINVKKSSHIPALYHFILMLYFTKDVIFSKYFIVNKVNFLTYIKTFFKILPFASLLIKEK